MRPISARIQFIFQEFYYKKAKSRHDFVCRYADAFLANMPISNKVFYTIDAEKMLALIDSYYLDVIRFKEYHFNCSCSAEKTLSLEWATEVHSKKLISRSKVASYTAKWFLKYSPIFISSLPDKNLSKEEHTFICAAPAILALHLALSLMGVDPDSFARIDRTLYEHLIYHFRFRTFDERSAFIYFEMIREKYAEPVAEKEPRSAMTTPDTTAGEGVSLMTKRYDTNTYTVFIAGAQDCDHLREVAKNAIEDINGQIKQSIGRKLNKLEIFDWKKDKKAGHTENYQRDIFKEMPQCDILIINFWYKFGAYTIQEYEYFIEKPREHDPEARIPKLLCCVYGDSPPPDGLEQARNSELQEWIRARRDNWAEIAPERYSIKTPLLYSRAISKQLQAFLDEPSE